MFLTNFIQVRGCSRPGGAVMLMAALSSFPCLFVLSATVLHIPGSHCDVGSVLITFFSFCVLWCFDLLWTCLRRERLSLSVSPFPLCTFCMQPTSPKPIAGTSLMRPSPPITFPGIGITQLGTTPRPWSQQNLFKPAHCKPADLHHSFFSSKPWESFSSIFLSSPSPLASCCSLVLPCVALCDMACPPLWELWVTNYLFNDSCLLICWPHQNGMIINSMFWNGGWGWGGEMFMNLLSSGSEW